MYAKGPGINMSLGLISSIHQRLTYNPGCHQLILEYPSYSADPVIGDAFVSSWEQYADIVTSHEVAHAYQKYVSNLYNLRKDPAHTPHGFFFKETYATLRKEINKTLPDQKAARENYELLLKSIKKRELYGN